MSISALRVSLKPVAVTLHIMKFCYSVIDISSRFTIGKTVEETAIAAANFFLNSHPFSILKVSFLHK